MHESELRRFLAARAGTHPCLSYRTDERGRLRLRPEPAPTAHPVPHPLALGALALLLAACAGHRREPEVPGTICHDSYGGEVACIAWSEPEAFAPREGCPVRPTAGATDHAQPIELEPMVDLSPASPDAPVHDGSQPVPPAAPTRALPTSDEVRVNFSVDPADVFVRGRLVGPWIDRDFVPTAQLWKDFWQRRAERKTARLRWRASQRVATSR